MRNLLVIFSYLVVSYANAQITNKVINDTTICYFTNYNFETAKFTDGGEDGFHKFVIENLRYPDSAFKYQIEDQINVQFLIDSSGNVKEVKTLGVQVGYGLENEAIRVIQLTSGKWTPASQNGKNVEMRFRFPCRFGFHEDEETNTKENDTAYSYLDVLLPATFTGGEDSLNQVISDNLFWPYSLGTTCGNFIIVIDFVVDIDGTIGDIKVINDVQFEELKTAAIKALEATNGGWSPAYKDNKLVKMKCKIPITFGTH